MAELSDTIHARIVKLCEDGDAHAGAGDCGAALENYWSAWELLPEPKTDWNAATWILTAIGDANLMAGDFQAARDNLSNAMRCPDAVGNPYIHLRLGQSQYELGDHERAADELARAYMGGGARIFEKQHPKFFEFLKSVITPPEGGW